MNGKSYTAESGVQGMTVDGFKKFRRIICATYTRENALADADAVEIWMEMLADIPDDVAMEALKRWIVSQKWSPAISDIREYAVQAVRGEVRDWGDAWESVIKAVGSYGMMREKEALASMDELTRDCVRNIGFRQICMCQMDELGYYKKDFESLYKTKLSRQYEKMKKVGGIAMAYQQKLEVRDEE